VALSDGDPAVRPAPRRRFGPDLKPRVAAAAVMGGLALGTAWVGGVIFAAFWWLASVVVLWEWQRLVGGARLAGRVALGGLFIAMAALFALHNSILGVIAGLVLGAAVVGWLAGRGTGTWAGVGALYAGALVASVTLLRISPSYGLAAILWVFAVSRPILQDGRLGGLSFGPVSRPARPGRAQSSARLPARFLASCLRPGRIALCRCSG
jgi:phosphatidate cytidylyltransferase